MEGENQGVSISGISTEKIQKMFHAKSLNSLEGRGIRVSHKPKEERRMIFICGDDIASLIKRFENESK